MALNRKLLSDSRERNAGETSVAEIAPISQIRFENSAFTLNSNVYFNNRGLIITETAGSILYHCVKTYVHSSKQTIVIGDCINKVFSLQLCY